MSTRLLKADMDDSPEVRKARTESVFREVHSAARALVRRFNPRTV